MTDTTHELTMSRWFAAPPEVVFRAFSDPEQLAQWMGPLMFTVPLDSVDVDARSGGHWRMAMVSKADPAQQSPIDMSLTEVVENALIVGYETAVGWPGLEDGTRMVLSLEFLPERDGTRLELRQGPVPDVMSEMVEIGWMQAFHKLDGLLATPAKYRNNPNTYEGDQ